MAAEFLVEFGSGDSPAHPGSSGNSGDLDWPTFDKSSKDAYEGIDMSMASISLDEISGDSSDLNQPASDESEHNGIDITMASISLDNGPSSSVITLIYTLMIFGLKFGDLVI